MFKCDSRGTALGGGGSYISTSAVFTLLAYFFKCLNKVRVLLCAF